MKIIQSNETIQLFIQEWASSLINYSFDFGKGPRFNSLKNFLLSSSSSFIVLGNTKKAINIEMSKDDFYQILRNSIELINDHILENSISTYELFNSKKSSSWLLVTSYYSSFFAAIGIMLMNGDGPIYLTSKDAVILNTNTSSTFFGSGTYFFEFKQDVPKSSKVEIIIKQSNKSIHADIWEKFLDQLDKKILNTSDALTKTDRENLSKIFPSSINKFYEKYQWPTQFRNQVNYQVGMFYKDLVKNDNFGLFEFVELSNFYDEETIKILNSFKDNHASPDSDSLVKFSFVTFNTIPLIFLDLKEKLNMRTSGFNDSKIKQRKSYLQKIHSTYFEHFINN